MKAKLLVAAALALSIFNTAHAQTEQPAAVAKSLLRANFLGLEYEQRITDLTTININPGVGFSFWWDSRRDGFNSRLHPGLGIEARRYYNLAKRLKRGKNIANNSGNFVALSVTGGNSVRITGGIDPVQENDYMNTGLSYGIGPVWGIQRNYKSGFNLSLTAGGGYGKSNNGRTGFMPLLGGGLGFLIYKR
jgi:hypothetical protein